MATRRGMAVVLIAVVSVLFLIPTAASGDPPERTDICHFNSDGDPGVPEWELLEVNARSLQKHLAHGDGYPGGYVPGSDQQLRFDDACVPYPVELVFAVAYGDTDPLDGDFDPDVDVLIAKLIDGPSFDGVPGSGDEIRLGGFPTSLFAGEPGDYGSFTVTSHIVDSAVYTPGYGIVATASGVEYVWADTGQLEEYRENAYSTVMLDFSVIEVEDDQDALYIDPSGPSVPDTSYIGNRFTWPGDQVFMDIDIYYSP